MLSTPLLLIPERLEKMPLPAALLARLQKRGIVKDEPKQSDEVEEVFAEDYDDPVNQTEPIQSDTRTQATPQPVEIQQKEEFYLDDGHLIYATPACPNRANKFHTCADYCKERWGMKEFRSNSEMGRKRDRMLRKYPLPDGWVEVADPETNRYYYWNLVTDQVSWLSPIHPSAEVTLSADKIRSLVDDSGLLGSQDDDLHLSDEDDLNDSHSSMSSSSSSESDSDEEYARKKRKQTHNDKRGGKFGGRKQMKKDELDPMDPASYSEVPRGSWSSGLERGNEAKTGADTTASGPLFQQRPYPSPGEILRRNASKK